MSDKDYNDGILTGRYQAIKVVENAVLELRFTTDTHTSWLVNQVLEDLYKRVSDKLS